MNLNEQIKSKLIEKLKKERIKKTFFISDLHFDDDRLNLYGRDLMFKDVKEFNNYIIKKWNENVTDDDLVIVLGDCSFSLEGLKLFDKCNGEKWLIKGNYDISIENGGTAKFEINDKILSKYFTKVVDDMELIIDNEIVYLNHYPTNARKDCFNIVGHIHGTWKVQRNMINVGCDAWHFVPISENLIKFQINGIRKYYDQNVFAGELIANTDNRKGIFKVLKSPNYDNVSTDDIYIFLAGPIQGSSNWQEDFIKKLKKEFENVKLNKNIVIASPKRDVFDKKLFDYDEQVKWESYYLEKSSKTGVITFWLAKEKEKLKGRSYAQTSRFEIGEWFSKGKKINDFKFVIGYEKGFDGIRYIIKKFKDEYNYDLLTNENDMIKEIKKEIIYKLQKI